MGFVDKVKGAMAGHEDKIEGAIDHGGDFVDSKTGGQHASHVDQAQEFLKGHVRQGEGAAEQPQQ